MLIIYLMIQLAVARLSLACKTHLKTHRPPHLICAEQGSLSQPNPISNYTAHNFIECRDSCRPYNGGPCNSFAFNNATGSCRLYRTNLASQGFTKSAPDGFLYYSETCFVYDLPFTDGGFENGYKRWTQEVSSLSNATITSPGFNNSKHAAFLQVYTDSSAEGYVQITRNFGPLCATDKRTLNFAYKWNSGARGSIRAFFGIYTLGYRKVLGYGINFSSKSVDSLGHPPGQWKYLSIPFDISEHGGNPLFLEVSVYTVVKDSYLGLYVDSFTTPEVTG